jgi:hypothetical protein
MGEYGNGGMREWRIAGMGECGNGGTRECGIAGMVECGNGGMRKWGMREWWGWGNAGIYVNEFFLKFLAKERFKYVLKGNPLYCNDLYESVGVHGFFINNQYYN